MGISGAEGDDRFKPETIRALVEVAALLREFRVGLGFDFLRDRKVQLARKDRCFRVVIGAFFRSLRTWRFHLSLF